MKLEEGGCDTVKGDAIHGSIKLNHKQQQAENPVCSAEVYGEYGRGGDCAATFR